MLSVFIIFIILSSAMFLFANIAYNSGKNSEAKKRRKKAHHGLDD